jgi:transcriptional regulator with XRE-family HTH domain
MTERETWAQARARRMAEPGAAEAYEAAKLAFHMGEQVRAAREKRGWSQEKLAAVARMKQPAVARFEAGGTVPKLDTVHRLLTALGGRFDVSFPAAPSPRKAAPVAAKKTAPVRKAAQVAKKATPVKKAAAAKKTPAKREPRVSA